MQSSGGPRNSTPGTLPRLFFDAVAKYDKPDALQYKVNGTYQPIASSSSRKGFGAPRWGSPSWG